MEKRAVRVLSRHEKEMGIQIGEMEKYKWICSQQENCDVGKEIYIEWAKRYAEKVRQWLGTLVDDDIDRLFNSLSETIKHNILYRSH